MNSQILKKSTSVGLFGAVVLGLFAFLRVGSDDTYVGFISGLAALTGFIVISILTLIILLIKDKKSNLSRLLYAAILLTAIVLLFGVSLIWI